MIKQDWSKSSYSKGGADNCVECHSTESAVHVRDSQNRERGHLAFSAAEWDVFLTEVKRGSYQ